MRVTTIHGTRDIRLEERPTPTIEEPTDAIIKVSAGASAARISGRTAARTTSRRGPTIGHEMIGIVEEVGIEVRVLQARATS